MIHFHKIQVGLAAAAALVFFESAGLAQPPKSLAIVNAASGGTVVAPDSIASAFGLQIGASTQSALSLPLPTVLSGVSVQVTDAAKAAVMGSLFLVSPNQINFTIPPTVSIGPATVDVLNGNATSPSANVTVAAVAPGIFTAKGDGTGVPAAIAIRRSIDTQTDTQVPVYQCSANACVSVPIDLSGNAQVFLVLFGTGIRGRSSLANVTATLGGVNAPVLFAGPQTQFPGLDQVNVTLPSANLHGEQDLILTVDGKVANSVRVNVSKGQ